LRLTCSGADGNGDGVPDGYASTSPSIGPLQLCGPNVCNGPVTANLETMVVDADFDGVANDDDFTPELCDEADKATAGTAGMFYWHYANGGLYNLAQSVGIDPAAAYSAYDYVVLIADNATSNPGNINKGMFKKADKTFPPTRQGVLDAFRDVTSKGYRADFFAFAHGYEHGDDDAMFEVLDDPTLPDADDMITGEWLVDATDPCLVGTALFARQGRGVSLSPTSGIRSMNGEGTGGAAS
jgi:hypothetical protein